MQLRQRHPAQKFHNFFCRERERVSEWVIFSKIRKRIVFPNIFRLTVAEEFTCLLWQLIEELWRYLVKVLIDGLGLPNLLLLVVSLLPCSISSLLSLQDNEQCKDKPKPTKPTKQIYVKIRPFFSASQRDPHRLLQRNELLSDHIPSLIQSTGRLGCHRTSWSSNDQMPVPCTLSSHSVYITKTWKYYRLHKLMVEMLKSSAYLHFF